MNVEPYDIEEEIVKKEQYDPKRCRQTMHIGQAILVLAMLGFAMCWIGPGLLGW